MASRPKAGPPRTKATKSPAPRFATTSRLQHQMLLILRAHRITLAGNHLQDYLKRGRPLRESLTCHTLPKLLQVLLVRHVVEARNGPVRRDAGEDYHLPLPVIEHSHQAVVYFVGGQGIGHEIFRVAQPVDGIALQIVAHPNGVASRRRQIALDRRTEFRPPKGQDWPAAQSRPRTQRRLRQQLRINTPKSQKSRRPRGARRIPPKCRVGARMQHKFGVVEHPRAHKVQERLRLRQRVRKVPVVFGFGLALYIPHPEMNGLSDQERHRLPRAQHWLPKLLQWRSFGPKQITH